MQLIRKNMTRRRRGLTLIETLLAIALGAGVLIGIGYQYYKGTGDQKTTDGITQVEAIVGGVRSLYAGQSDYASLTNTIAGAGRVFPATMIKNGDTTEANPQDPWGKPVTVAGTANQSFTVTYNGVPQDACAKLSSQNLSSVGGAVISLTINGTAQTLPLDAGAAIGACNAGTSNVIIWEFR